MSETTSTRTSRPVVSVVEAHRQLEGDGFEVRRPFPSAALPMVDPFLLLDEMGPVEHAPGEAMGASDHPHRGFETVTYVLDGEMEHRDSAGNAGSIGAGDVQWMTAGSGVVHSEKPSDAFLARGGRMHGFQLWVNLPRADKMTAPRYQDLRADAFPKVERDGVRATVIAGDAFGVHGPADTHVPITYVHVHLDAGAATEVDVPNDANAFVYAFAGSGAVGADGRLLGDGQAAVLGAGDVIEVRASNGEPLDVLVLAGAPLREPVVRYGPFVMNTKQEIVDAVDDYQAGRMGVIGSD
jgi:redox-sensitive bicupin YhaK (pirin superfamily)